MTRSRIRWIGLSALVVLAAGTVVASLAQPTAEDILTYTAETLEAATDGHAVLEIQATTPEKRAAARVEVWGRRAEGADEKPSFRMEVLETDQPEAVGVVAVSDGSRFWLWVPERNTVYVGTADEFKDHLSDRPEGEFPETPQEAVAQLLEYFTADRAGTEELTAGSAYILDMLPIPEQMPEGFAAAGGKVSLWIDRDRWIPLAAEYVGGSMGEGRVVATLVELDIGLSDDLFTFQIPDGAETVALADLKPKTLTLEEAQASAGADLLLPADLPQGAALVDVIEVRGLIAQRYSLPGGGSFTIAQGAGGEAEYPTPSDEGRQVIVRGVSGTSYTDESGGRALLAWTEGGVSFWVGGDLTAEQALAVAESLR